MFRHSSPPSSVARVGGGDSCLPFGFCGNFRVSDKNQSKKKWGMQNLAAFPLARTTTSNLTTSTSTTPYRKESNRRQTYCTINKQPSTSSTNTAKPLAVHRAVPGLPLLPRLIHHAFLSYIGTQQSTAVYVFVPYSERVPGACQAVFYQHTAQSL